jgi:protein-S-isoprenylcysteine O-methyltransferase Ste14
MKQRIQVNGIVLVLSILLIVFFPFKIIRHNAMFFDNFWEVLGVSCVLLGQLLRVSARGYKAENSKSGHSLVTSGPYGFVRNPMYLGIILIGLGIVLTVLYPWVFLVFIAGFLYRYVNLFIKEEKLLVKTFGDAYRTYLKRVPRLLPKASSLWTKDISTFLPMRLSWVRRELLSIIAVLVILIGIEAWEELRAGSGWGMAFELLPIMVVIVLFMIVIILLAKRYEYLSRQS